MVFDTPEPVYARAITVSGATPTATVLRRYLLYHDTARLVLWARRPTTDTTNMTVRFGAQEEM